MGVSNPVTAPIYKRLEDEVEKRVQAEQKLADLQREMDLLHLWMDAADIPREQSVKEGSTLTKKKTLLQRVAIFCALHLDYQNYQVMRENTMSVHADPFEGNDNFLPLHPLHEEHEDEERASGS